MDVDGQILLTELNSKKALIQLGVLPLHVNKILRQLYRVSGNSGGGARNPLSASSSQKSTFSIGNIAGGNNAFTNNSGSFHYSFGPDNSSAYTGVRRIGPGSWSAFRKVTFPWPKPNKKIRIGVYATEDQAALASDAYARKFCGPNVKINFPNVWNYPNYNFTSPFEC